MSKDKMKAMIGTLTVRLRKQCCLIPCLTAVAFQVGFVGYYEVILRARNRRTFVWWMVGCVEDAVNKLSNMLM